MDSHFLDKRANEVCIGGMKARSCPSEPHGGGWGVSSAKLVPAKAGNGLGLASKCLIQQLLNHQFRDVSLLLYAFSTMRTNLGSMRHWTPTVPARIGRTPVSCSNPPHDILYLCLLGIFSFKCGKFSVDFDGSLIPVLNLGRETLHDDLVDLSWNIILL